MPRHISEGRQTVYYLGMALMVLGGLLFASTFVTHLLHFGDFTDFDARAQSIGFRAFGGMALLMIGGFLRVIGSQGLAGSGVILNPEQARGELEPYSRMTGGMLRDVLDEAQINIGGQPAKQIMIRCRSCGGLSQETAKFCQQCGTQL